MSWSAIRHRDYPTLREQPERFWRRVDRSGGPAACWPWLGARSSSGYGRAGKRGYAHRLAFELHVGRCLAAAQQVLHSCDVPTCCNPSHLRIGSPAENARDMLDRERHYTPFTRVERARHGLAPFGPAYREGRS